METQGRIPRGCCGRCRRTVVSAVPFPFLIRVGLLMEACSVLFGILFELNRWCMAFLIIDAAVMSPMISYAVLLQKSEYRRFCDINSYMQQFINGMILHQRIVAALDDVLIIFPDGQMHDSLLHMQNILQSANDIQKAEKEAFAYLEQQYPNSQISMIHEFARRVERRGGTFEMEMKLLDEKRKKWEKRTEHCQNTMRITVTSSLLMYVAMIFICVLVQRMMPEELSVMTSLLSQVSECILISLFYVFACMVIAHIANGWLHPEKVLDGKRAKKLLAYMENQKDAESFHLFRRLKYFWSRQRVKTQLKYAVPRWLFDVCLLTQKYNITVSITESLKTAPAILEKDIKKLLTELQLSPSSMEPYLNFLGEYQMQSITATMRMLVSIQNGTAGDLRTQMDQLIEHSMNMLDEMDRRDTELRDAWNVRYNIYPMIPAAIVMGGYLFSMVIKIFRMMASML